MSKNGPFVGFVLLDSADLDVGRLARELRADWGIAVPPEDAKQDLQSIVAEVDGMTAAISLISAPVPNGEAAANARTNFRWPGAEAAAQAHKAHIMVAALGAERSPMDTGCLFVKLCAACLRQPNAVGIYVLGTVLAPDFYCDYAKYYMEAGEFPLLNLVFFGLYSRDGGRTCCGYTYGMTAFGKKEIEVMDSPQTPEDVFGFLHDVASYVLKSDVTLKGGETIGFSEEQKLAITESAGAAVDGITLKINLP